MIQLKLITNLLFIFILTINFSFDIKHSVELKRSVKDFSEILDSELSESSAFGDFSVVLIQFKIQLDQYFSSNYISRVHLHLIPTNSIMVKECYPSCASPHCIS